MFWYLEMKNKPTFKTDGTDIWLKAVSWSCLGGSECRRIPKSRASSWTSNRLAKGWTCQWRIIQHLRLSKKSSNGRTKTVGSKEKFRKRKFAEELLGIEGSVDEAFDNEIIPEATPLTVLGSKVDKVKEYKPLLCWPAIVMEFGICGRFAFCCDWK